MLADGTSGVRIPAGAQNVSLSQDVQLAIQLIHEIFSRGKAAEA
jgi:hypothetical protein